MALTTEQIVRVLADYVPPDLATTKEEAADELRQSLGEDPEAKLVLESIANDFWQLGFNDGRKIDTITDEQLKQLNLDLWVKNLPGVARLQVESILRSLGFTYPIG